MCGVSGFYSLTGTLDAKSYYQAHLTIAHRGPDDEGFYCINQFSEALFSSGDDTDSRVDKSPHIAESGDLKLVLGHRRLSIIDLSPAGHQPFHIGSKILCFNGEIYNYLELRAELELLGVAFDTDTDTEVFLNAFIIWGEGAFKKFNGMWGAAIYDIDSKELLLVRDQFGIKPLYYLVDERGVFFGSEIKYFKSLGVLGSCNESAIYQYLRYAETDYDETTFFEGLFHVAPGEYVKVSSTGISGGTFWSGEELLSDKSDNHSLSADLKRAVSVRLRSDVPVGSLLSGGLDSSLIVGITNEIRGLDRFQAYSAVFNEEIYSEKKFIDLNASFLEFTPNFVYINPDDLTKHIEELLLIQETPFRSLAVLSQHLIYKQIAKDGKVKVLLNGQGADEIFTGYMEHYSYYFLDLLIAMKWKLLVDEFRAFCKNQNIPYSSAVTNVVTQLIANFVTKRDKYRFFKKSFSRKKEEIRNRNSTYLKKRLYRGLAFSPLKEYLRY